MPHNQTNPMFEELIARPANSAMLMAAYHLGQARRAATPSAEQFTTERELRVAINDLVAPVPCSCACGEAPQACECPRCLAWLQNRVALEELGVFLEGVRSGTSLRRTPLSDTAPLLEDLRRLTTEGRKGRNFLVVSAGEVFVQFLQHLEPARDTYLLCEAATADALFAPGGKDQLLALGFAPPTPRRLDFGEGEKLIVSTSEEEHPCFYRRLDVATNTAEVLLSLTALTAEVFRRVYGCAEDVSIELELHIESGV